MRRLPLQSILGCVWRIAAIRAETRCRGSAALTCSRARDGSTASSVPGTWRTDHALPSASGCGRLAWACTPLTDSPLTDSPPAYAAPSNVSPWKTTTIVLYTWTSVHRTTNRVCFALPLSNRCLPCWPGRPDGTAPTAHTTGSCTLTRAVQPRRPDPRRPECVAFLHARIGSLAKAATLPCTPSERVPTQPALLPHLAAGKCTAHQPGFRPPRPRIPPGMEGGELVARLLLLLQHVG